MFARVVGAIALLGVVLVGWYAGASVTPEGFVKGLYAWFCWLGGLALRQWHLKDSDLDFPKYYFSPEWAVIGVVTAFAIYAVLEHLDLAGGLYFSACIPPGVVIGLYTHPDTWLLVKVK